MAFVTISPNMNLPIPITGQEPGPQYASDVNASLTLLDAHDHSPGSGVPVTPNGLNINADLPIGSNNLTQIRSARFASNAAPLALPADLQAVYSAAGELYYNDALGNQVQITNGGSVAGAAGNIANLVAPASATYVSANSTFVWQSNANVAANMDFRSAILRNSTVSSFGLTLQAPTLLSNYTITLPVLPISTLPLSISSVGTISAGQITTAQIQDLAVTTLKINDLAVTTGKINDLAVTTAKIADMNVTIAKIAAEVISLLSPTGVISAFGGNTPPTGWLYCDGALALIANFPNLFAVIGTAFGGDGITNFRLPDLRGRFLRGTSDLSARDPDAATRTAMNAGGNTGNMVGSVQLDEYESHRHLVSFRSNTAGNENFDSGNFLASRTSGGQLFAFASANASNNTLVGLAGGAETRPLNAYVNFIIKT